MAGKSLTDEDWLLRMCRDASVDEIEAFVERVAIRVAEGWSEITARSETWYELQMKRKCTP
jgi:hypothetical protein